VLQYIIVNIAIGITKIRRDLYCAPTNKDITLNNDTSGSTMMEDEAQHCALSNPPNESTTIQGMISRLGIIIATLSTSPWDYNSHLTI